MIGFQLVEVSKLAEYEIEAGVGRLDMSVQRRTCLNLVCVGNRVWIELSGGVSYAETVQPVNIIRAILSNLVTFSTFTAHVSCKPMYRASMENGR